VKIPFPKAGILVGIISRWSDMACKTGFNGNGVKNFAHNHGKVGFSKLLRVNKKEPAN